MKPEVTTFTRPRHLFYPKPDQSSPCSVPLFVQIHLILSPLLHLGLPSGLFPSGFPVHTSSLPHPSYMPRPSYSRFYYPHKSGWAVQIIKFLIMKFSLLPYYLDPLRHKYSPQYPILKRPQPTFLPQCQRPSFIPIQNNRQNYISVYLNL
jgi:hypothetical protein